MPRLTEQKRCPQCESEQPMPRRLRPAGEGKDWLVEFWSCTVCPWEREGHPTTEVIEGLSRKLNQAARRKQYETRRHGQPSNATIQMTRRLRKRYSSAVMKLGAKVRAHGS